MECLMVLPDDNSPRLTGRQHGERHRQQLKWIGYESEPREKSSDDLQPALHMPEPLSITWGVRLTIKEVIGCDMMENLQERLLRPP